MNQVNTALLPLILTALILFIIGSLIYDHCQRGYFFTTRSSNEKIFIEQALQRIPTCHKEDHSRQRALLYALQAWSRLAHSHHIRYWISHKTLAGYLHHHDLAPYDHDIDIVIMAEDTPQLIELKKANYSSMYQLQVHPQWFMTKVSNRSYFPSEGIDFIMQNARFTNQKSNVSINIWPMYTNYLNKNTLTLVQYLPSDNWISSPITWTFPLEPCVLSGIRVWCPAQPKKLSASIYKQSSIYFSCVHGKWVNSNQ